MNFPDLVTTAISIVSLTDHPAQCVYKGLLTFTNAKTFFDGYESLIGSQKRVTSNIVWDSTPKC